ncbi:hypothetical protein C8K30_115156 [Promicromonospora sp. AC04]|uniref:hypothetical protein n=1 Tax=Promicromonospora sp. AC04 TaxID=2135723 RepID=UPI000D43565F|nr:hypothetical protein [Promicromonospora sp. AC04]PUB20945.1 hypothetical protein C8K30_115156 [Promicromonospora sp. AC04]
MDEFYEIEEPASGPADPEVGVRHALDALDGLDDLPPADHVARFEAVHDALRAHLSGDA